MIQVKWLSKIYDSGFQWLSEVSFDLMEWDIYGFLGHNWAGKTTTINILTTLLEATSGEIYIDRKNMKTDAHEIKKIIGYLPESVALYSNFTVYENLEYFAKLSGIENPRKNIDATLSFLEVDYSTKKVGELSKGMRQRIGIAQAILHNPKVLFLDEPNTGLDPVGMKQLRDIILKLSQEKWITIFMNTHLLSEVGKLCNKVGILNQGKLVFSWTIDELHEIYPDDASLETIYLKIDTNA